MDTQTHVIVGVGIVLLIAAVAVGLGVYMFVGSQPEPQLPSQNPPQAPVEVAETSTTAVPAPTTHPDAEYEACMEWLEEEAAKDDEEAIPEEQLPVAAPVIEEQTPAPPIQQVPEFLADLGGGGSSMPRWRSIWADLNLTQEEQSRLRAGFGLLMARWASMPPEAQAAERARMQEMRMRWEGMDDQERQETSQRLRNRFEEWRASGQIELPELTLD